MSKRVQSVSGSRSYFITLKDVGELTDFEEGDQSSAEQGGYHIQAFRKKYLDGKSFIFGSHDLNTDLYQATKNGVFFYNPNAIADKEDKFLYWRFDEIQITPTPVTVTESLRNVDSEHDEILYTVELSNEHRLTNRFVIDKKSLMSRAGLLDLNNKNVCIKEQRDVLEHMQNYFSELINKNKARIPKIIAAEKTGWKNNNKCFIFGDSAYMENGVIPVRMLNEEIKRRYEPVGSIDEYKKLSVVIERFPIARLMLYIGCCTVLLKPLGLPNANIFIHGKSTTGKTKLCMLAVSPFHNDLQNADSTKVGQEFNNIENDCMPVVYDEVTGNEEKTKKLLYPNSSGKGKTRGNKDLTVNRGKSYSSIIFYNGENPLLNESDNVGQMVRLIEIHNPIEKSEENKKCMDLIEAICTKNHGLLADPFLRAVFDRNDDLQGTYESFLSKFEKTNAAGDRKSKHFAAFAVAGEILESVFTELGIKNADPFEIVNEFYFEDVVGKPIEDEYIRALRHVWGWINSNMNTNIHDFTDSYNMAPDRITTPKHLQRKEIAWIVPTSHKDKIRSNRICFETHELKNILKDGGFNSEKILHEWADHNIIDKQSRTDNGKEYGNPKIALPKILPDGRKILAVRLITFTVENVLGISDYSEELTLEDEVCQFIKPRIERLFRDESREMLARDFVDAYPRNAIAEVLKIIDKLCENGEIALPQE